MPGTRLIRQWRGQRHEVRVLDPAEDDAVFLTLDGQIGIELVRGDQIRMRKAAEKLLLVRPAKKTYYQILRNKLKWGER